MIDGRVLLTLLGHDGYSCYSIKVYRNLLVTEKECEVYKMSRVESEVGLSRDDLVGMAILNGCDFNPDVRILFPCSIGNCMFPLFSNN